MSDRFRHNGIILALRYFFFSSFFGELKVTHMKPLIETSSVQFSHSVVLDSARDQYKLVQNSIIKKTKNDASSLWQKCKKGLKDD